MDAVIFFSINAVTYSADKNIPCADRIAKLPKKFLRGHQYNYNLGNTVLTLTISALVLPWLYYKFWYPNRTKSVIISDQDTVVRKRVLPFPHPLPARGLDFPSKPRRIRAREMLSGLVRRKRARLQRRGARSNPLPMCWELGRESHGFSMAQYQLSRPDTDVEFIYAVQSPDDADDSAGFFQLQVVPKPPSYQTITANRNETDDSSKALSDSSMLLSPSLWIAIYDPTLDLASALENGYTRMVLINANGLTAINLGLNRRQAPNTSPAYDYKLSVSTIPAAGVNCGATSTGSTAPCHISLFLQFPSFDRQNSRLGVEMKWEEVVAAAGSWFSLFQIAGWIFSGLAFHTG
ncbi:hypothetical protein V499_04567 [Pseudogymnoascus sp. VKM F-103]|nr:hypothetical protein V499_04567 [Pseudogymnoascus sp. VKM F-103]